MRYNLKVKDSSCFRNFSRSIAIRATNRTAHEYNKTLVGEYNVELIWQDDFSLPDGDGYWWLVGEEKDLFKFIMRWS